MEWPQELLDLFEDPMFDNVKVPTTPVTADERMQKKIDAVKLWIEANGREPQMTGNISEKLLSVSLKTLKENGLWI